jgi:hypothetical protein
MDKSFISFTQALENGQMVSASGVFANYDGETLDMEGFRDGTTFYAQLTNEDIMQLLAARANRQPLEELILEEVPSTASTAKSRMGSKSHKSGSTKSSSSKRSRSKKRSSQRTRKSSS